MDPKDAPFAPETARRNGLILKGGHMMRISGLHILLTYQCTLNCDHCFVWSGPWQTGTMTLANLRRILGQAEAVESITSIYFEGGEPFLVYPVLVEGVREAAAAGFDVGIVSNAFWAISEDDAVAWLEPLAGRVQMLSISSDLYHWNHEYQQRVANAVAAAAQLDIPTGTITVAQPEAANAAEIVGQLPPGESKVMYRGRAAVELVGRADHKAPWSEFTQCPYENLRDPGRVHVDPFGYIHLCQGIVAGNLFDTPLRDLCEAYDPETHPVVGPLLAGGPAALVEAYDVPHESRYADACHLCYETRQKLRSRLPDTLAPDQMYGPA